MNTPTPILMLVLLGGASTAVTAVAAPPVSVDGHQVQVRIHCTHPSEKCPAPPLPPVPPAPPPPHALPVPPPPPAPPASPAPPAPRALPAPPAPPAAALAAVPPAPPALQAPALPPPPPQPPQPVIPEVPAQANAACAAKQPGSTLSWKLGEGETMGGVCVRQGGKMVFALRSYDLRN